MFIIQSSDLSQIYGCDLEQNQTGVIVIGKGQHHPQYSQDIIRIHSLMIYSDIIEQNIEHNITRRYKNSFIALYSIHPKIKKWRYNFYRTVHDLSVFYRLTV